MAECLNRQCPEFFAFVLKQQQSITGLPDPPMPGEKVLIEYEHRFSRETCPFVLGSIVSALSIAPTPCLPYAELVAEYPGRTMCVDCSVFGEFVELTIQVLKEPDSVPGLDNLRIAQIYGLEMDENRALLKYFQELGRCPLLAIDEQGITGAEIEADFGSDGCNLLQN